jgi:enoyl-CoA hydratase
MGSFDALLDQRLRVLHAIEYLPKPVIAVLYGYCLGGGLELPLACHLRLAAAEVWPLGELFQRARELALELADMPAVSVREMLRCVVGAGERSLDESIAEERRAVRATMGTPDQREGMQAFLEKRRPRFNRPVE